MRKPTPPVPARRRPPFARLLLAAALLLPAALHAQVPSPFPLKRGGVPIAVNTNNCTSLFGGQEIVELTPNFALRSDGTLVDIHGKTVLTDIVSFTEIPRLSVVAVNKDNKLVVKASQGGSVNLDSTLAAITDAVSVENTAADAALGRGIVFRKDGKNDGFSVDDSSRNSLSLNSKSSSYSTPRKGKVVGVADELFTCENTGKINKKHLDSGKNTVVAENAFGVFYGRDISGAIVPVGIFPRKLVVFEGGVLKTRKPEAEAIAEAAARRLGAVRATRGAGEANPLENASAVFFGRSPTGTTSAAHARTFTLRNDGRVGMTVGTVTVDGANPGDFAVAQPAVTTLDEGESVDFTVQFTPGADGARTAALHIASNDEQTPSLDLDLTGFGQALNATPVAAVDTLTAPAGGATTFTKLLANDTDADADPIKILSVAAIDGTTAGLVSFDPATGLVAYTSPEDVGTDSFEYTITDGTVTQSGTVNVDLVDPVPLAASKTFQGADEGESVSVTFGKLSPVAAAARKERLRGSTPTGLGPKLMATFTEQLGGRTYKGRTSFDADDNAAEAVLNGSEDNATVRFEVSVDEDGNPLVFANGLTLRPDVFDKKHPAPAEIVGTYTMSLPGASLDEVFRHGIGDSVASVTLAADGSVKIAGVMADGRPFSGKAQLDSDRTAPFNIALYKGKARGSFSGEIEFVGSDAPNGSLAGHATWTKPPGIANLPESEGFSASGDLIGGFYSPDELPTNATINYTFGTDGEYTNFLATGAGPLSAKFTLTGQLADTTAFSLDSKLTLKTGLILGKRAKKTTTDPKSFTGVILMEQDKIVGSTVFTDPGIPEIDLAPSDFTAPVTGTFPP